MSPDDHLKILYLVHDLGDPAVHKRVLMLKDGGAIVTVAGFHRSLEPVDNISAMTAISLGRTYNGNFLHRLWSVLTEVILAGRHREIFKGNNIIIARNLEMLAIAVRGRAVAPVSATIVYECLDIHRLMLNNGIIGKSLRWLEGWLSQKASALITSSPEFVNSYFDTISNIRLPVGLIENKIYNPASPTPIGPLERKPGPPWKIGWFGAIRCIKSLALLTDLARGSDGDIEVIIRGRPATDVFKDFDTSTANIPGVTFLGPYKNPEDLEEIYREVHFTWAIDMFEEGLNSAWLLPNRLYEGGIYHSIPIAEETVETGRFLKRLGIGVTITEPKDRALKDFFSRLTVQKYKEFEEAAMRIPHNRWAFTTQDCKTLVDYLRSLS